MSFDDLVREGVALANELTDSLQVTVQHEAWTADDGLGGSTYAAAVPLTALVETRQQHRRLPDGREIVFNHLITILQPVAANGATGRKEPIDSRDRITLPNGETGPIISADGFLDPDTNASYFHQVALG